MPKNLFEKNQFALERELIRINEFGEISTSKNRINNQYITTDFGEAQIELITKIHSNEVDLMYELNTLHSIVIEEYDDLIWPNSMPPILNNAEISSSNFAYKKYLSEKYGLQKQFISGIHYNFNYDDELLKLLNPGLDFKDFKNKTYFKVARNYQYYRFVLIYLLGATPTALDDFPCLCEQKAYSIRMSECGYHNKDNIKVSYKDNVSYIKSIIEIEKKYDLQSYKELYEQIRIKPKEKSNFYEDLLDEVAYLEIRSIDINPFAKNGIELLDLKFLNLFMSYLLFINELPANWQELGNINHFKVARYSFDNPLIILKEEVLLNDFLVQFLDNLDEFQKSSNFDFDDVIAYQKKKLNIENTYAFKLKNLDFLGFNLDLSKLHKESFLSIYGIENSRLELSTQLVIKEAYRLGLNIDILSENENFIKVSDETHEEFIKEATKTSLDNYVNVLKVESKLITKKILESQFFVPKNYDLHSISLYDDISSGVVIKPNSTNFGLGISIFKSKPSKKDLFEAFKLAFEFDRDVLCEEYFEGSEFRFLVINNEVNAVLYRDCANVVGDGVHSIEQLIYFKNQSPLREKNYTHPLSTIEVDDVVLNYLKLQNLSLNSILKLNQKVYLRKNSNISTGGDSIDVSDKINVRFKNIAIDAVKTLGLNIAGVDMIINNDKYVILEVNFNPAIHIHTYPLIGVNRRPALALLKALGFDEKNNV